MAYYIYNKNVVVTNNEYFVDYQEERTIAKKLGLNDKNILRMLYASNMASKCISKEILLNTDQTQSVSEQMLNQLRNLLCATNIVESNKKQPLSGVDIVIPIIIIGIRNAATISEIVSMGLNALVKVQQYSDVNQAFGYSNKTIAECNLILNSLNLKDISEVVKYNGTILITYVAIRSFIINKNQYIGYDQIFNTIISSIYTTILNICGIRTMIDIMDDILLNLNENSEAYMITDPDYIINGSFKTLFNLNGELLIHKVLQLNKYNDTTKGILILLIYKLYNRLLKEPYITTGNLVNNRIILNTEIDNNAINAMIDSSSNLLNASKTAIKNIANLDNVNSIIKERSSNIIMNSEIDLFRVYNLCYTLAGSLLDPVALEFACRLIIMGFNKNLIINNIYELNKNDPNLVIKLDINSYNYFCSSILGTFTAIVPYVGIKVKMDTIKPIISAAKTTNDLVKNIMTELINLNLLLVEIVYSIFLLLLCIFDDTNSSFIMNKLNEICSQYYSHNDYNVYVTNIGIILDAINNGHTPVYTTFKDRYEFKIITPIVDILLEKRIHIAILCGNQSLINNESINESIAIASGVASSPNIYNYLTKKNNSVANFIIKYEGLKKHANLLASKKIAPFILNEFVQNLLHV